MLKKIILINSKKEVRYINKKGKLSKVDYFTVDRIEEEIVVLENRDTLEIINVLKKQLPKNLKEGILLKKRFNSYKIEVDKNKEVEQRIKEKMDKLWE